MKKWIIMLAASGLVLASCAKEQSGITGENTHLTCMGHIKETEPVINTPKEQSTGNEQNPGVITITLSSNKRISRD